MQTVHPGIQKVRVGPATRSVVATCNLRIILLYKAIQSVEESAKVCFNLHNVHTYVVCYIFPTKCAHMYQNSPTYIAISQSMYRTIALVHNTCSNYCIYWVWSWGKYIIGFASCYISLLTTPLCNTAFTVVLELIPETKNFPSVIMWQMSVYTITISPSIARKLVTSV